MRCCGKVELASWVASVVTYSKSVLAAEFGAEPLPVLEVATGFLVASSKGAAAEVWRSEAAPASWLGILVGMLREVEPKWWCGLSGLVTPAASCGLNVTADEASPGGQSTGLQSEMQLLTTARKKTMSEVGNLKASKGARIRWPAGSMRTNGPIMFESVGQPCESMNWIELALFAWNDSRLFSPTKTLLGVVVRLPPDAAA